MAVFERARQAVQALPGVENAALSFVTPVSGNAWGNRLDVSDGVALMESSRGARRNQVSPEFFEAYGQRLVAGRNFADSDRDGAPLVAIVNEAFARTFLNGANPIGHTLRRFPVRAGEPSLEIVGVAGDAVYRRLREAIPPTVYSPVMQSNREVPSTEYNLNVRAAAGSLGLLTRSVADAIAGVNKDLALTFRPLSDQVSASLAQERIVAMLSGFVGGLALLLAGLGLYGVTSYAVSRRRGEIGIRMALGAPPESVIRLVLGRVSALVGIGILVGAGLSFWGRSSCRRCSTVSSHAIRRRSRHPRASSPLSGQSPVGFPHAAPRESTPQKCCEIPEWGCAIRKWRSQRCEHAPSQG
jgi:hypothetical protein